MIYRCANDRMLEAAYGVAVTGDIIRLTYGVRYTIPDRHAAAGLIYQQIRPKMPKHKTNRPRALGGKR